MSSFSRFQDINQKRGIAGQNLNAGFIFKGYPTISIKSSSGQEVQASVVNKQEKDMAYIYTNLDAPLAIGSSWGAKGLNWLISEEVITIKDVKWHKYVAFLCNVEIDGTWGYFIGPEKKFINIDLEKRSVLHSEQKPILILQQGKIKIDDKIMIKDRAWLIQESDEISSPGIGYYSLVATTMNKEVIEKNKDNNTFISIEEKFKPIIDETIELKPNIPFEIETENGYFRADNQNISILKLEERLVSFMIPFGIKELTVQVKQKGQMITKYFKGGI